MRAGPRKDPLLTTGTTLPLASLTGGTLLLNLVQKAKLNATLGTTDAAVKLDASTLTVGLGSLANVAGGSFLNVSGNLAKLDNGSTLNILQGGLVTVAGGSVFTLGGGSLVKFGATGINTVNLTNNSVLCAGCTVSTTIPNLGTTPVLLKNGALAGNVTVNPGFVPFAGVGGANTVNVSGPSGAVLILDGATSKVVLRP